MNQMNSSDKPIQSQSQDRFKRRSFATRIAETIIKNKDNESLVVGLYGIWGEGKTSVLNMIEEKLVSIEEIIVVKFNPWRFRNEDELIIYYFKTISKALDKELNSRKERVGGWLKKFGSLGSVIKMDLSKVGESLSHIDVEDLKDRVNDFLLRSEKRLVVFIDDVDRLDKQELYGIFKLVKLTGDFQKTNFVLAFDDEMVASSIGERYAEGNKFSGYNFLEKIVQVPLRIPKAITSDLQEYLFELLNDAFKNNEIELKENEAVEIGGQISQNLMIQITTPRLAVRFANSLSFLVPLLKGEVNMGDLILLEGVRLFYPKHFQLIRRHPEYFISSSEGQIDYVPKEKRKEELNQSIQELGRDLDRIEQRSVLGLLKYLFPLVREVLDNYIVVKSSEKLALEKRVASSKYFNRYFIYTIPAKDVSDVEFDDYLVGFEEKDIESLCEDTQEILKVIPPSDFLGKVMLQQSKFSWNQRKSIIEVLCLLNGHFDRDKGIPFMFIFNLKSNLIWSLVKLLENQAGYSEFYLFVMRLTSTIEFDFVFDFVANLDMGSVEAGNRVAEKDIKSLKEILLERAVVESSSKGGNLFVDYPSHIFRLLEIWYAESPIALSDYIQNCIDNNEDFEEVIIESLTTTIYSSSFDKPFRTDFGKDAFALLRKIYDIEKINFHFSSIKYSPIRERKLVFLENKPGFTVENAIRQFFHWYELFSSSVEGEVML